MGATIRETKIGDLRRRFAAGESVTMKEMAEVAAVLGMEPSTLAEDLTRDDPPHWLRDGSVDLHQPLANDEGLDPEEAEMRRRLGLRPTMITNRHPDTRPCPPWCAIGEADSHTISLANPHIASHIGQSIEVVATQYGSRRLEGDNREAVMMRSTFAVRLSSFGHTEPVVSLMLDDVSKARAVTTTFRLSLKDAEELITALSYLTATARAARELA